MDKRFRQETLSNLEISAFCEQMAMVLKAGISVAEGIAIMKDDAHSPAEGTLLETIYEKMQEGETLAFALEESGVFPKYLCKMTQIGEESGTLDEVFSSLESYYERQEAISKSIRSALAYPLIMIGMMVLVIVVLLTKVMPVFQQIFRQLGMEMSGFPKSALLLGNMLSKYAVVFVSIVVVIMLFFLWLVKTKRGRVQLEKIGRCFKFSREIFDKIAACRFAGGLSLALKSGLTPERGIELAGELNENQFFEEKIVSCRKMLAEGSSLSEAFHQAKIFTGIYARRMDIAGRTGVMDEMMGKLADQIENEVEEKLGSAVSMLEPTLVFLLSVIVGTILFSVMLPLLGILAGL